MNFIPEVGKYLIKPRKEVKVTKKLKVPDDEKNKDKKPTELHEVKEITQKVPSNFQFADVVSAPEGGKYLVGDVVVFRPNPSGYISFDLIKGVYLIEQYLVIGKWVENNNDEG